MTTVKLSFMKLTPKLIEFLSHFKFLCVLIFDDCSNELKSDEIQQFNLDSLRHLKFTGSRAEKQVYVLQHLKCKELDTFVMEPSSCQFNNASYMIQFLNELDRCDQIEIDVDELYFHDNAISLTLEFLWSKLKLSYSPEDDLQQEKKFIEALCRASKPNAESEIELNDIEDEHENLWPAVFNSCRGIKALTLRCSSIPFNLAQLRLLPELQKLDVDEITMKHTNFPRLARILTGVTHLEIHQYEYCEYRKIKLSAESALQLQPFFDQIIELTLHECYLHKNKSEDENDSVSPLEVKFKSLRMLVVKVINSSSLHDYKYHEDFTNFCIRNQSLKHLEIHLYSLHCHSITNHLQIKRYEKLHGTSAIQTCNILVGNYYSSYAFINWREAKVDEVELFGRVLTDQENRFFI